MLNVVCTRIADKFVTSSGTTAGLETYDFDAKAFSISVDAIFSGPQQTISISEVCIPLNYIAGLS